MTEPVPPDLFTVAGLDLEPVPDKPKRARKPRPPTPAERAAAVRLQGARRSRGPVALGQRSRVGQPRVIAPAPVVPFPLARNAEILSATVDRLPHFYDRTFEKKWVKAGRNLEQRLIRRGIRPDDALSCAREVLDAAFNIRATQAEKEQRNG